MNVHLLDLASQVQLYSDAVAAGDLAAACACVDWLADWDCSLADVLLLLAGAPPDWQGPLHRDILAKWCEQTEPERSLGLAHRGQEARGPLEIFDLDGVTNRPVCLIDSQVRHDDTDWIVASGVSCAPRWQLVAATKEDVSLVARSLEQDRNLGEVVAGHAFDVLISGIEGSGRPGGDHPAVLAAEKRAVALVRRDLARRILALFPEVSWERRCSIEDDPRSSPMRLTRWNPFVTRRLAEAGFDLYQPWQRKRSKDRRSVEFWQELAAPDWIPPESR